MVITKFLNHNLLSVNFLLFVVSPVHQSVSSFAMQILVKKSYVFLIKLADSPLFWLRILRKEKDKNKAKTIPRLKSKIK